MSTEAGDTDIERSPVVAVVGPTAAGKSALAMALAERCGLALLCCDSVQVYRGLDVGSAKPSPEERARIRHELLDLVHPDGSFSAADWARGADAALERGRAIIVGGTGFYLRSFLWSHSGELGDLPSDDPERIAFDAAWTEREREDPGAMHRALHELDPETARSVHPNNAVRALRALWLCHRYGEPVSAVRRRSPPRIRRPAWLLNVDPGVSEVDASVGLRCERMIAAGWVDEVVALRARGYDARHKAMRSLGYQQLLEHVEGHTSLEVAIAAIQRATRAYARRQRTYFRTQFPGVHQTRLGPVETMGPKGLDALASRVLEFLTSERLEAPPVR